MDHCGLVQLVQDALLVHDPESRIYVRLETVPERKRSVETAEDTSGLRIIVFALSVQPVCQPCGT